MNKNLKTLESQARELSYKISDIKDLSKSVKDVLNFNMEQDTYCPHINTLFEILNDKITELGEIVDNHEREFFKIKNI